jgi:uncharacterized protein (TIGR02284 family)
MTPGKEKIFGLLGRLLTNCRDAEQGFQAAAGAAEDDHLRVLFGNYSQQRAQLATELEKYLEDMEAPPQASHGHTVSNAIHRAWITVRSALEVDDQTLLAECDKGDHLTLEQYDEVLREDLSASIRQMVRRQRAAIESARERICELERSHAKAG